jgi:UDP-3-O-[3-hydroxymyristoyl] glucosamine N-acyltransferase
MPIAVAVLSRELGASIDAAGAAALADLDDVAAIDRAGPRDLTYLESEKHLRRLTDCRAGALLVTSSLAAKARERFPGLLLVVPDPQVAFVAAMLLFRPPRPRATVGISNRAIVAASAVIGRDTNIHPLAVIGERVRIGAHCDIHPGVVIGDDCVIADQVTIHPHAALYAGCQIGQRAIIHAGAVVGADGFGYRFAEGKFHKLPHTGRVEIGDDVEIGACATIDRAMIGTTRVGEGTKIDNLVMVGHNCEIGRHNAFASQVGFAGSTTTGDFVRCGGQAGIADHLKVGDGAMIGAQAGVIFDVPAGEKHHGSPAGKDKEKIRHYLAQQKVPELLKEFEALSKQVTALQATVASLSAAQSQRAA